jgi:hypothetical protein
MHVQEYVQHRWTGKLILIVEAFIKVISVVELYRNKGTGETLTTSCSVSLPITLPSPARFSVWVKMLPMTSKKIG